MAVNSKHFARAWYESLKESDKKQWPEISDRFLNRLQADGNLSWLRNIQTMLTEFEQTDEGVTAVKVRTAHEMPEKSIKKFVAELVDSKKIALEVTVDQDLIGGVEVRTKDHRWDLSMKRRLKDIKKTL